MLSTASYLLYPKHQPFLLLSSHRLFQIIIKPGAPSGWKPRHWALAPTSAKSRGQSMAFFWSHEASLPLHCMGQEGEGFTGTTKRSIPKGILEGHQEEQKTHNFPEEFPRTSKERRRTRRGRGGGSPCRNPGTLGRADAPGQAHPPSSRGTAVRPHRGCLWTQQARVTPQARAPGPPSPPPQSQLAGNGVGKKYFFKDHLLSER